MEAYKLRVFMAGFYRDASLIPKTLINVVSYLKKKMYFILPNKCMFKKIYLMTVKRGSVPATGAYMAEIEVITNVKMNGIERELKEIVEGSGFEVSVSGPLPLDEEDVERVKKAVEEVCEG